MANDDNKKMMRCSFCGKPQDRVARLIAGPGVCICNECVEICRAVLEDEDISVPRPVKAEPLFPPQADAQHPIEADEVVHVGVGDEDVRDAENLSGRKGRGVPQVEEDGPTLEEEVHVDTGVVEGAVDGLGMELGSHGELLRGFPPSLPRRRGKAGRPRREQHHRGFAGTDCVLNLIIFGTIIFIA